MKNVIITGATGMIGNIILTACLDSPLIERVTMINRRTAGISHDKLTEIIHTDFTDFKAVESCFKDQDIAYYCLGVYTGAVDRKLFRTITVDYTIAFATVLKQHSPGSALCFLSGQGADQSENSRMMFAKDKGAAENFLVRQEFDQLNIFRPAYIYPVTPRKEPNLSYRIMRSLYPVFKWIFPNQVITSTELAHAMFTAGLTGENRVILENRDIKMMAGET